MRRPWAAGAPARAGREGDRWASAAPGAAAEGPAPRGPPQERQEKGRARARPPPSESVVASGDFVLEDAAPDLVLLDRFEQRLEVALAEAVVALALDELEEDRADGGLAEPLEQHLGVAALHDALPV